MKRYIEHLKTRPPHERHRFSLSAAAVIVGVIFVAWISTLGMRLSQESSQPSADTDNSGASLVAAVSDAVGAISQKASDLKSGISSVGGSDMDWNTPTSTVVLPPAPAATVIDVPTTTDQE
ncbi:MAG TPA: hypothetical protein VF803_01245 [Candidatus Paceibacterota bacterium]